MEIKGTLPVALKILVGQTNISSKDVVMRPLTAIEYLNAQANIAEGQYIAISDLTAMTKLIAPDGTEHVISYDALGHSSRSNLSYLSQLREKLDAKEQAEDSEQEHDLSER